jgi:hypothetical protein
MGRTEATMPEQPFPISRRIDLPGHFAGSVDFDFVRPLGNGCGCSFHFANGTLNETTLSQEEASAILRQQTEAPRSVKPAHAESIRILVESARVRLAYSHDRHFPVSLSGVRTLAHQIEAIDRVLIRCRTAVDGMGEL